MCDARAEPGAARRDATCGQIGLGGSADWLNSWFTENREKISDLATGVTLVAALALLALPACTGDMAQSGSPNQVDPETAQALEELVEQPEEFPEPDLIKVSWSAGPLGNVKVGLTNMGNDAASIEIGGILIGQGVDRTVVTSVETAELAAGATVSVNVSRARLLRTVAAAIPDGTLIQFYVRSSFSNGYNETDYSDVAATTAKNVELLASGDSRRVWGRSGPPVFDADVLRIAKEKDPEAYASAMAMMAGASAATAQGGVTTNSVVSKKLCFQQLTTYAQGETNVGEDVWAQAGGVYRPAGANAAVVDPVFLGGLDIFGCTPQLSISTGTHSVQIQSKGAIGSSQIAIGIYDPGNADGCDGCRQYQAESFSVNVDTSATQTFFYVPTGTNMSRLNVFPAVALALLVNNGNAYEYRVQVRPGPGGSATSAFATYAQIRLIQSHQDNKINITHELGHAFWRAGGGPDSQTAELTYSGSNPPCSTCGNQHCFNSIEYVGGAIAEAFGNFYAASTWNNTAIGDDCRYSDPNNGTNGLDCAGQGYIPYRYMKSTCAGPFSNQGVEWDWTRTFWHMRTHASASGVQPTMLNFRDWFTRFGNPPWPPSSQAFVYSRLDGAANLAGEPIDSLWDFYKVNTIFGDGVALP